MANILAFLNLQRVITPISLQELIDTYRQLINKTLPATYTYPVRNNHCFGRIVLDWLFKDCWYQHLQRSKPAIYQLSEPQLQAAINRMNAWLQDQQLLIADNEASLRYRNKL